MTNKRKYLDDLGIKPEDRPEGFCPKDDVREKEWKKQREIYGFDERETWGMDTTFYMWLYERLMMFNEKNILDTTFHKVEYEGETYTMQDCIDKMIEGCKLELTKDYSFESLDDKSEKKINDVIPLLNLSIRLLWW